MQKVFIITIFLCNNFISAKEPEQNITYQCPWPDPEFSILATKPVNLLRMVARPRGAEKVATHYVDIPFNWIVIDQEDDEFLNIKTFDGKGLQVDWTDTEKRPMRYTYRYLYMSTFGLLLPSSDGKPLPLETSAVVIHDMDPVTQKEGDFVVGYDHLQNKKLYESHLLVPSHNLEDLNLEDIPFSVEYPHIEVDKKKRTIACVYPEKIKNKVKSKDKNVVFTGALPQEINVSHSEIKKRIRAVFYK